ncbi:fimbrial protein [Salmonella enterica subsp. enterica]|nr:fimbrial protein [Salmonella enterica]EBG5097056.1 fimbrial protein [Salmonella enterica subsp. enterica serovar India]ECI4108479.1 fimbrial protein [Salmonella enterica subsp. enterica]EGM1790979.1 fimbrial protein [Salmonella enterica subsp. enterica]EGR9488957.1 fimbrial protein [Salmonella enterica subsp. enterica]
MMRKIILPLLFLLLIPLSNASTLKFTGIVHAHSADPYRCTINDNKTIEVNFGTIVIDKINGVNYLKDIPWSFTCAERHPKNLLVLRYLGTAASFTADAVATSVDGLGIELQQNGEILHPGDILSIDKDAPPALKAVPVKQAGKALTEGTFVANAELLLDYL